MPIYTVIDDESGLRRKISADSPAHAAEEMADRIDLSREFCEPGEQRFVTVIDGKRERCFRVECQQEITYTAKLET